MNLPAGFIVGVTLFSMVPAANAQAPAYPSKLMRLIMPSAPGSAFESIGRLLTGKMGEAMGQPFITENRASANGVIGVEAAARAAPDGYSLLWATPAHMVTTTFVTKNLPFDSRKDFTPITVGAVPVTMMILHPSVPASTMAQFIDYAKKNPGKLSYGHSGIGSAFHLMGEEFNRAAGVNIVNVPYKTTGQSLTDVVGGRIETIYTTIGTGMPLLKAGKIKSIAVLASERHSSLPDVQTFSEALPSYDVPYSWYALFGPAGLPRPVVTRLHAELAAALKTPEARDWLAKNFHSPGGNTPDEFAEQYRKSFDAWGKVAKAAGVQPE